MRRRTVLISDRCDVTGGAPPTIGTTSTNVYGDWTYTGTGELTYTFKSTDKYVGPAFFTVSILAATAVDLVAQIKSIDINNATAASRKIVINLNAAATPTAPAADIKVFLVGHVSDSSVSTSGV